MECPNGPYNDTPQNEVLSEEEVTIQGLDPIYYKFRFTFTEQDKTFKYEDEIPRWKNISKNLIDKLLALYSINHLTAGIETLNKLGDRTWCHIHIHFTATENRQSILRTIKRFLADKYDQTVVGVKAISLTPEADLRDKDAFWRYPLKQKLSVKLCYGFTEEKLKQYHQVAKDCYMKTIQVNQAKKDKIDTKDTIFERLKSLFLKSEHTKKLPLLILATKFYVEEDKPINKSVIEGYVNTFMLQQNHITYEEFWGAPISERSDR